MSEAIAAIERLYRRVLMVVGRGRIKTGRDDGPAQMLQVRLGPLETIDNLPRLSEYGFNSMPPVDTDAIVLFSGGNRSDGVIIATGSQTYRMRSLQTGEVAISDDQGQSVYLTRTGIVINGAGFPIQVTNAPSVTLDTPQVHMTGNLAVDGSITAEGDVADHGNKTMAAMRDVYNGHDHGITGIKVGTDKVTSASPGEQQ